LVVEVEACGVSFAEQAMGRDRNPGMLLFPFVPGYVMVGAVLASLARRRHCSFSLLAPDSRFVSRSVASELPGKPSIGMQFLEYGY
jgi:hypothetical protein